MLFDIICILVFLLAAALDGAIILKALSSLKHANKHATEVIRFSSALWAMLIPLLVLGIYFLVQGKRFVVSLLPSDFFQNIPLWWTSFLVLIGAAGFSFLWTALSIVLVFLLMWLFSRFSARRGQRFS